MIDRAAAWVTAEALCDEAQAIARDCALAQCRRHLYRFGEIDPPTVAETARIAARMRPDLASTHAVAGYVSCVFGDRSAARRALGRALANEGDDFDSHDVAACGLFAMGGFRTAFSPAEPAANLRPKDYQTLGLIARAATALGDVGRSRTAASVALGRAETRLVADPTEPRAQFATCYLRALLGRSLDGCAAPLNASASATEQFAPARHSVLRLCFGACGGFRRLSNHPIVFESLECL